MSPGRFLVAALLTAALTGCFPTAPSLPAGVEVRGKILLSDGASLTDGILTLRPVGGIHGATAIIQKDGTFSLAGPGGNPAVVPGKYQVYVRLSDSAPKALRSRVHPRYQSSEDGDSDVLVEITEAKSDLIVRLKK